MTACLFVIQPYGRSDYSTWSLLYIPVYTHALIPRSHSLQVRQGSHMCKSSEKKDKPEPFTLPAASGPLGLGRRMRSCRPGHEVKNRKCFWLTRS